MKAGVNLNLSFQKYNTAAFGNSANSLYNKAFARVYIVLTRAIMKS